MELIKEYMNWNLAIVIYLILAIGLLIPTLIAVLRKVKLNPDGKGYEASTYFEQEDKERLIQHYSRINGTLGYWKNQAEKYRRFNNYTLFWTILVSILIPIISQQIGVGSSK